MMRQGLAKPCGGGTASVLRRVAAAATLALLAGCLPTGQGDTAPDVTPINPGTVEVTALPPPGTVPVEAPAPVTATPAAATPAATEAAPPEPAPPEPAPEPVPAATPPSPEARACQRLGGVWIKAGGSGMMTCQRQTGEGMKSCRRAGDCAGDCLARSGTCSPVSPLFGCNEVLDDLGRRTTQCVN